MNAGVKYQVRVFYDEDQKFFGPDKKGPEMVLNEKTTFRIIDERPPLRVEIEQV